MMKVKSPFGFGVVAIIAGAVLASGVLFTESVPDRGTLEKIEGVVKSGRKYTRNGDPKYFELSVQTGSGEKDLITLSYSTTIVTQQQLEGTIGLPVTAEKDYYNTYTLTCQGEPVLTWENSVSSIRAKNSQTTNAGLLLFVIGIALGVVGVLRGRTTTPVETAAK